MNKTLYYVLFVLTLSVESLTAQTTTGIRQARLARCEDFVQLSMDIDVAKEEQAKQEVTIWTPRLVGENDSIDFPAVAIMERWIYYNNVREGTSTLWGDDAFLIRHKGGPFTEHYARTVSHQPWMDKSTLKLIRTEGTPCDRWVAEVRLVEGFTPPAPDTTYVVNKKTRDEEIGGKVSGQARITFRVNRTEILPEIFGNMDELEKIRSAIRQVQSNPDVRITRYSLKGYASPEGSYANNERLAKGRTESLKQYMTRQWGVPEHQIATDYEPEDWVGMRKYVEEHRQELKAADALLTIIDMDMEPDDRLKLIANRHPEDYKVLFDNCFPTLRRTDYAIEYEWKKIVTRDDGEERRMTVTTHEVPKNEPLEGDVLTLYTPTRPWIAVKTNLLADALLTPNIELELPLGRESRWSLMVEDWFPWFLYNKNKKGQQRTGHRIIDKIYKNAYEVWTLGAELRYWFTPKCCEARPTLTGTFVGLYGAGGKYDWEWDSNGDQGEFYSAGLTLGYAFPLARHWNMEASVSAGAIWGPRRHYNGEYDDTHLIWKYNSDIFYAGPTKLKLSVVWLIPSLRRQQQKGGAR